ncbi:hypothetical protein V8E36_004587 [Tilletia maclaganii]
MRDVSLTFGAFVEGCLASTDDRIRRATTNWAGFAEERSFGPLRLVEALFGTVRRSSGIFGTSSLALGVLRLIQPRIHDQLEHAKSISVFRAPDMLYEMSQRRNNEIQLLQRSIAERLPLTQAMASQPNQGRQSQGSPDKRANLAWRPAQSYRLLQRIVADLSQAHIIDQVDPSAWDAVPLALLEENEGSISGTLAVLQETSGDLGLVDSTLPAQSSDVLQGPSPGSPPPLRRLYNRLPSDGTVLVAGDLKTHRNIAAALEYRKEYPNDAEKLGWYQPVSGPWHLHLNWVYCMFRMHFSTDKVGFEASLERVRDGLRRGKTALREEAPSYNEAWLLIKQTFSGRVRQLANSILSSRRRDLTKWMPQSEQDVMELLNDIVRGMNAKSVATAIDKGHQAGAHARLFLRDASLALELDDACRHCNVGRMLSVTKFLALGFAGAGKHLYVEACLDDIWDHRVLETSTWRTLAAARLINRCGEPGSFFGVDLHQEHINKALQRVDLSHGVDTAVRRLCTIFSSSAEVARAVRERHSALLGNSSSGRRRRQAQVIKDVERVRQLAEMDGLFSLKSFIPPSSAILPSAPFEPLRAADLLRDKFHACPASDALSQGFLSQEALMADLLNTALPVNQLAAPDEVNTLVGQMADAEDGSQIDQLAEANDDAATLRWRAWARRAEAVDLAGLDDI